MVLEQVTVDLCTLVRNSHHLKNEMKVVVMCERFYK